MTDRNHQQDLAAQIENYYQSGEFDKALEISARALESNPADLDVYGLRWKLIAKMFSEEDAKERIHSEIESLLKTHLETPEVLEAAYWGYRNFSHDAENIPNSLFHKMLQYPSTRGFQIALLGFAEQSEDVRQKWYYHERHIDTYATSDAPVLSWNLIAYEEMLWLAEENRSLASDDELNKLIDRFLKVHLSLCKETQRWFGWAYTEAVKWRLKLNVRMDKALEILRRAEARLEEEEEREWLVENNRGSVEEANREFSRLRGEIHLRQERWREAHDGLLANAPDFLESLWARLNENAANYFWMLGRSSEGMLEWHKARRYYADAHFAPTSHAEGRAGLERVYRQRERGETIDTFETFLKAAEAEYRIREYADREKIRQKLVMNRLNRKVPDFCLETLEGEEHTLSAMRGKVILLDVGASWCGPCNEAIPEVKIVHERFSDTDDAVVWGINDGETPQQVQKILEEHQPPWPMLLDPRQEVRKAYQIERIPFFILIDKAGDWQYSFESSNLIGGQPLIWLVEALLAD
ncbi:MAG: TlpA disulfide reductase family protein [Candidatus Poribacteria bacterium]|nr:TlpA disulfide reductase family protein [Candidatus Poribacteria bacterium]